MEIIAFLLLFCFGTASLCVFIHDCMEPGMIFRRYYLWLLLHWIRSWRKKDRWKRLLLKIMGLCIFCNSVYLGLIFLIVFNVLFLKINTLNLMLISPFFISIQHHLIKLLLKLK